MEADIQTLADDSSLNFSSDELDSIAESSQSFVGDWQTVISQTNWEKGKIILEWRQKLEESKVAQKLWSDPAWSRLVGEVSPQHVGRLRRTYDRFGEVYGDYAGLYWSHFFAALDWEDAEMWLEGAVQNNWSVSQMRYQRWETMGKLKGEEPAPNEIVSSPNDEGVSMLNSSEAAGETAYKDDGQSIQGPLREGPDFGDDSGDGAPVAAQGSTATMGDRVDINSILEELPTGIARPFRELRNAIADAKADDWDSVKRIHLVALVNDLRQLLRNDPKPDTV